MEVLEDFVFGVFLQHVVEKTKTRNELLGMLFSNVAYGYCLIDHFYQVVMTTEIEVISFFYLTVYYFSHVKVVRTFLLVAIAIFHNIKV